MKNRKFLTPLAALASVFIANSASATTASLESTQHVDQLPNVQFTVNEATDIFSFTLKRSDQEIKLAGHRSHSSHSSHSSHRSHYSSR